MIFYKKKIDNFLQILPTYLVVSCRVRLFIIFWYLLDQYVFGVGPIVRRPDSPTAQQSEGPIVRRPNSQKVRQSESPIVTNLFIQNDFESASFLVIKGSPDNYDDHGFFLTVGYYLKISSDCYVDKKKHIDHIHPHLAKKYLLPMVHFLFTSRKSFRFHTTNIGI